MRIRLCAMSYGIEAFSGGYYLVRTAMFMSAFYFLRLFDLDRVMLGFVCLGEMFLFIFWGVLLLKW